MKSDRQGSRLTVALEGSIGESTPLFLLPIQDIKELDLDLAKTTYINSIGVKNWILWTLRIPKACVVRLLNTPFVIATQASIVLGFATERMIIESIRVPYACASCNFEEIVTVERGVHYQYASPGISAKITLPLDLPCAKCKVGRLEYDFLVGKTFKFLG